MPEDNAAHLFRTNVEKATFALADLNDSDGGVVEPQQAAAFIEEAILESTILQLMTVRPMNKPIEKVNRIWIDDDVLVPGISGQAVPDAWQAVPSRSDEEMTAQLYKFQVRIDNDVFDDNIEGQGLKAKILGMLKKKVAASMEKLVIQGDTTSASVLLGSMNGILKSATLHTVDGGNLTLDDDALFDLGDQFPEEQEVLSPNRVLWTHRKAITSLRKSRSYRATDMGDANLESKKGPIHDDMVLQKVPLWPTAYGGANTTAVLCIDPKNSVVGVYKQMKIVVVDDQIADAVNVVGKIRFARAFSRPKAVVKLYDVSIAA